MVVSDVPIFERWGAPRLSPFLPVSALLLLLGLLATLQYRWVGQVGEAERVRLQAGARTRVEQLAEDFDREITRAFAWLQVDADMLGDDGGARFAARYERWVSQAEHPSLVAAVYVAQADARGHRVRRFDPAARLFVEADWPAELAALHRRVEDSELGPGRGEPGRPGPEPGGPGLPPGGPGFHGPFGFVTDDGPALVIPIFSPEAFHGPEGFRGSEGFRGEGPRPGGFGRPRPLGVTLVLLDRGYLEGQLLPALAARYFAPGGEFDYCVVVTSRRDPRALIYRSDPEDGAHGLTDASANLLEVRFDQIESGALVAGGVGAPTWMVRRGPRDPRRPPPSRGRDRGLWEVGVTHRAGSLEQVVAGARHRNLAVSFGTLLLLGASAVMVLLSSQRARRLASQQVEFVAGVSHELRTPVAVVCSAGENLADGLVRDPAEVRLYGVTIRDEGRRLAEMVEQVLEFAGIASRERRRRRETIAVADLVQDALQACAATIAEAAVEVEVRVAPGLPPVLGDRAALRRALQNLIQNSVRHAAAGRWIGISAEASAGGRAETVRLTVRDRGPGIPPGEEGRIFKAFYRGRQALAAGVSGSGLGLSLVQRIVEAHGGTVEVKSAPGAGSAFTLSLPAAAPEAQPARGAEEERAQADPAR